MPFPLLRCAGYLLMEYILGAFQKKLQQKVKLQLIHSLSEVEKEVAKVLDVLGLLSSKSYAEVTHLIRMRLLVCCA